MVFSLAPNTSSISRLHSSITAVRMTEMMACSIKQPPRIFSASASFPRPMAMDARGAPPEATKAEKAETIRISGIHTPTPVRARLPSTGIWPI